MTAVKSNNVPVLCANVYAPTESEPFGCQVVINGVSWVNVTLILKINEWLWKITTEWTWQVRTQSDDRQIIILEFYTKGLAW